MVSQLVAKQTKIWHVYDNQDYEGRLAEYNATRIHIKPSKMHTYFRKREQAINDLEGQHRTLLFYYEDLPSIDDIHDFLGIERVDVGGAILKQRRAPKNVIVTNYEELEKEFRDTKYQWMF